MNKLKNIFKLGRKSKSISPKLIEAEFQGKKQPVFLYTQYGTHINPPNDLIVGLLADQGNEESLMGLVTDKVNREELEDGEIAFGVPGLNARIFFRKNGHITFKIDDQEGGDFAARFLELKAGFDELVQNVNDLTDGHNDFLTHGHPVATTGTAAAQTGATTGTTPPPVPVPPTTANIDDAKIDEIELPGV